jgi:hypothetical protein
MNAGSVDENKVARQARDELGMTLVGRKAG